MEKCCRCKKPIENVQNWYGLHENCFIEWFELPALDQFSDIIPRSQSLVPQDNYGTNTSFFHGAFRKYSSRLSDSSYILKVVQKEHPELPATEFLCNQIYESFGVEIPNYYLLRYPENHFCFVTRNFMSNLPDSSLVHIYHYLKNRAEHNCENLVSIIGDKTGRRTEQERFAYLTLIDSLVGNHDRHGRNLGFIQTPKGMQLSPFYFIFSYIGLDDDSMLGADLRPRGAIFTRDSNEPTMKDYVYEWNRLGYKDVVMKLKHRFSSGKLNTIINESFISEKRQKALLRLIDKRGDELCEN